MELEQKKADYAAAGLNVASISYDSVAVLRNFAARKGITYPMLSDPDSKIIRAFGILNETAEKGTPFYGIPYPGAYLVDPQGVVQKKFFEPDYRERYTAGSILLKTSPDAAREGWTELETPHLKLRYRASDNTVAGGNLSTLLLEVTLPPKMHVYAPGVDSTYIPVKWDMAPDAAWKETDARWPESKTLHLAVINETVPVYEQRFSVSRDVIFAAQKELMAAAGDARQVTVKGTFRYQACDEKECFPPVNVPLEWTFHVVSHDRQRVPEALQRK